MIGTDPMGCMAYFYAAGLYRSKALNGASAF